MNYTEEMARRKKIQDAWLVLRRVCTRCAHEWQLRTFDEPKVCPKCKSPYWDKERLTTNN